ncbi:MAG: hypothetical protein LBC61_01485 [Candidatus Peribacteria bacterium]|jgi:hypothetical protein|nr:hypothetical protein [Candidatus Peribacteria bacterium]
MSQSSTTNYITYSSNSSTLSNTPKELDITTPTIKIQSGLDTNNECDKEKCSINFTYEPTDYKTTEIVCKWDF